MEFNEKFELDLKNHIDMTAAQFISWRDSLNKVIRDGRLMFDVPGHYKWLDERELFRYYMDIKQYEK